MKKNIIFWIVTFFCAFSSLFSDELSDEELNDETSRVLIRTVEEVAFESQPLSTIAYILLSDETIWEKNCTPDELLRLGNWRSGDEIYVTTNNQNGICLENIRDLSTIYAQCHADSSNGLLTILRLEVVEGGWFSSTEYYVHLSDETVWHVITWAGEPSNRWKSGQLVFLSRGWLKDRLINITIPYESALPDDRSLLVE